MSIARKVNPKDAPVLVHCPYSGAIYDFQPMLKMMYEHYFFQTIEDVPDELDATLLFIATNINRDTDAQYLAKATTTILLVKEFFKSVNNEIS